jgi:putative flippase GtrA
MAVRALVQRVRSLDRKLVWQGVRYAITGAGVAGVYVGTTLVLSHVVGIQFQIALAIGFFTAITAHFSAHRLFVWGHESDFALSVPRQIGRYLPLTAAQYGFTALTTSVLPSALGVPTDVIYLATVVCVTLVTFVLLRTRVFHAEDAAT